MFKCYLREDKNHRKGKSAMVGSPRNRDNEMFNKDFTEGKSSIGQVTYLSYRKKGHLHKDCQKRREKKKEATNLINVTLEIDSITTPKLDAYCLDSRQYVQNRFQRNGFHCTV